MRLGWWLLSGLGSSLYGALTNTTQAIYDSSIHFDNFLFGKTSEGSELHGRTVDEKMYIQPPEASEIAAGLSREQLDQISASVGRYVASSNRIDVDEIIERVLLSPSIQNIINNYNMNIDTENDKDVNVNIDIVQHQQQIINNLKDEINKIKLELLEIERLRNADLNKIYAQFESENAKNAHLVYQINRCCRRNIVNIEGYVSKILTDLLSNPEFLRAHLSDWLHTMFIAKHDLELHIANVTQNLNSRFDSLIENNGKFIMDEVAGRIKLEINEQVNKMQVDRHKREYRGEINLDSVGDERVREIVKNTLAIYDADKTGLVDYAMEPMGGQVLTTRCTESYHSGTAVVSILGIPLWYPTNSPRTVITPGINPGECWAFQNFPGFVVIKLATSVKVEAFSMEHISKLLVPDGKIDSAPKDFEVYGLKSENDMEPILIGTYVYEYNGEPLQYFAAHNHGLIFDTIELRVISNHRNPNYTCLYRFRVHGRLASEAT